MRTIVTNDKSIAKVWKAQINIKIYQLKNWQFAVEPITGGLADLAKSQMVY